MEKRLKQQRNLLLRRVGLIFLAVWVAVSSIYCFIRVNLEKSRLQNEGMEAFSAVKQKLTLGVGTPEAFLLTLQMNSPLFEPEQEQELQVIVTDQNNGSVILNTANKTALLFGFRIGNESVSDVPCLLDHNELMAALGKERCKTVLEYLTTERTDGKHYELVCTKFHILVTQFVPVELVVLLCENENEWFSSNEILETYPLADPIPDAPLYNCNDIRHNIIPLDFLRGNHLDPDYIGSLNTEQQEQSVAFYHTEQADMILYISDTVTLQNDLLNPTSDTNHTSYLVQYAVRIDLWQECRQALVSGVIAIFGFFLIISLILYVMIWKMVKEQILHEQRRIDLTNALAHDLKTPLFVISGYAYSLKEHIDESEREEYLDRMIEQTDQINSMLHKMLSLSRLDSYTMTLHCTEFDLLELVQEVAGTHPTLPDGKTLTVLHVGNNLVNADRELIKTVLQNLTDNAILYSLPNSTIQIQIDGKKLTIQNRTEPITKSELNQLWQPFVRKDKSRRQTGNGLGLAIVKSILDLHRASYELWQKDDLFTIEFHLS